MGVKRSSGGIPSFRSRGTVTTWSPILDMKATADDPPDDEFDSTTLDSKWTVVNGSSGTVSMLEVSDVAKYDLATRDGWLLMQVGRSLGNNVDLRQDYTLGDGDSIIVVLAFSYPQIASNSAGDIGNNDLRFGIALNDTDTGPLDGNELSLTFELDDGEVAIQADQNNGTQYVEAILARSGPSSLVYLRIMRSGTNYACFYSLNAGASWSYMGDSSNTNGLFPAPSGTPYSNLWLFARTESNFDQTGPRPVMAVDWIRLGSNDLDPWG